MEAKGREHVLESKGEWEKMHSEVGLNVTLLITVMSNTTPQHSVSCVSSSLFLYWCVCMWPLYLFLGIWGFFFLSLFLYGCNYSASQPNRMQKKCFGLRHALGLSSGLCMVSIRSIVNELQWYFVLKLWSHIFTGKKDFILLLAT